MTTIGAVIMAGGRASRMGGTDKGMLRYGGQMFLDRLLAQLHGLPEILLSVDSTDRYPGCGLPMILDAEPDQGPLQGLAQALSACRSDALLAVAVDMPLFERGLGEYLAAFLHPGCRAVAALDRTGCRHPLCALYAKSAEPVLRDHLATGKRRLQDALDALKAVDAPLAHSIYPDSVLANINTPKEFAALRANAPMPVLAVCGIKDSGKTTLLCRLLSRLREKELRLGVIKHDGHDFVPDVPGADSFRLREAGAERVAVYSPQRMLFTRTVKDTTLESLLPQFAGLDLALVEGGKNTSLPKLEVVRAHQGGQSHSNPAGLLALCADAAIDAHGIPVFSLDDVAGIGRFVLDWLRKGATHA